jgi:Na+-driven multidrug efflux pump
MSQAMGSEAAGLDAQQEPQQQGPPPGPPPDFQMPSLMKMTISLASSIMVGLLAGLALQIFIIAFLGWQGPRSLYIRSIYGPVGFITLSVTEGVTIATQITAGIAARSGDGRNSLRPAPTYLYAAIGLLAVLAGVFFAASHPILSALGVTHANYSLITDFVLLTTLGSALGLAPTMAASAIRGVGKATMAAVLGISYTVLNIAFMLILNSTTDLGVMAVPIGDLMGLICITVITLRVLPRMEISLPAWRPRRDALPQLSSLAVPVGASFLLLSLVTYGYLRVLHESGSVQITGFSLGQTLNQFFLMPSIAIASGAAIAVNIRFGEDRLKVNQEGLGVMLRVIVPIYVVMSLVVYLIRTPLAEAFTPNHQISAVATSYLTWMGPTLILFGGTFAMLTYLEQIGLARASFTLNLIYFVVILAVAFALPQPVTALTMTHLLFAGNLIGFWTLLVSVRWLIKRAKPRTLGPA